MKNPFKMRTVEPPEWVIIFTLWVLFFQAVGFFFGTVYGIAEAVYKWVAG